MPIDPEQYRREAEQSLALSNLEKDSLNFLESGISLVSVDTIIYEHYRHLPKARIWLEGVHSEWLKVNMGFNIETSSSVFYRYIILPYPYAVENWHKRQQLIEFILLNLHVHLWHGIVCIIKFLDPRTRKPEPLAQEMNFFIIPRARTFYDFPSFNRANSIKRSLLEGSRYEEQQKVVRHWAHLPDGSKLIWLFYDECHFEPSRLRGWHWTQLRAFFKELQARKGSCPECSERPANHLDHIAPISHGYPQTILNFRMLCERCNKEKSDQRGVDPFQFGRLYLPDWLISEQLRKVLREPPPWLDRISRPKTRTRSIVDAIGI